MTADRLKKIARSRTAALIVTVAIFLLVFRRIRLDALVAALDQADYRRFLAAMIPNTIFYFCWDTLVLTAAVRWFHGPVRYRDLLPVRAASYVVAAFNTNVGRGALAAYLSRRLGAPFLQLGSTVLFLILTEYVHLVLWATIGLVQIARLRGEVARELLWAPPGVALLWVLIFVYTRSSIGRPWALLRTFRLAPVRRYLQIVLLRAPMFFVSLCLHYAAARSFGLEIPFIALLTFLPVIFMLAALPISVAHLGTTQAGWIILFGAYGAESRLLAFSLAAHLTFVVTRAALGVCFLPRAYRDLVQPFELRNISAPTAIGT
jgi:uncharacterized membrane protein YbhN (UPF0104 family)